MSRLSPRYFIVAAGQDLSLFVTWAIIPVWATEKLHAGHASLGALPLFGSLAYVPCSILMGRLSDRVSRTAMVRLGLFLYAIFCGAVAQSPSIGWVFALSPLGGIANALIWPGMQALMADESAPGDLSRNIGAFSFAWSVGKTAGFYVGGPVYAHLGLQGVAWCGGLSLALIPFVPKRPAGHRAVPERLVSEDGPPSRVRDAYLWAAWIANFSVYGLGSIINFQYPKLLIGALHRPAWHFNAVMGTVSLAQTAAFLAFGRFAGWRYRPAAFFVWQGIGGLSLLAIGLGVPLPAALAAAVLLGAGSGLSYAASIYYSIHSDAARGRRAGVHEAIIGSSNSLIPLAGGALTPMVGWAATPFAFSAALVLAGVMWQVRLLSRAGALERARRG